MGKPDVDKMMTKKDIKGLIKALKYKESDVQKLAALYLGEIGDARAVVHLIEALKDKDMGVRCSAADALGKIGDVRAVEHLIEALKDEDEHMREWAAVGLGGIKDTRAVEPLIRGLKDKAWGVRLQAKKALDKLGWKPRDNTEKAYYIIATPWDRWDELVRLGKPIVEILIDALKDEYDLVRMKAAMALGEIGDERALEPLTQILNDKFEDVQKRAKEALEKIMTKET
jgi:HEAT repeat protein